MAARVHILSPTDLKPGSVSPNGRVIEKATLFVNKDAGTVIVAVEYEGESALRGGGDVFMWPLANGWAVDGVTA